MYKEKIGTVTEEEKDEIQKLYERKLALNELMLTFDHQWVTRELRDKLYDKISIEIPNANKMSENWWNEKACKYHWKSVANCKWTIDFEKNDIYLVTA